MRERIREKGNFSLEQALTNVGREFERVLPHFCNTPAAGHDSLSTRGLTRLFREVAERVDYLLDADGRGSCTIDYLEWYSPQVRPLLNRTSHATCGLAATAVLIPDPLISGILTVAAGCAAVYGFSKIKQKLDEATAETPIYDPKTRKITVAKRKKTTLAAEIAQAYAGHLLVMDDVNQAVYSSYSVGFARRVAYLVTQDLAEAENNPNYLFFPLADVARDLDEVKEWLNGAKRSPSTSALGTAYFWTHPEELKPK